jgi:hypothetical protein
MCFSRKKSNIKEPARSGGSKAYEALSITSLALLSLSLAALASEPHLNPSLALLHLTTSLLTTQRSGTPCPLKPNAVQSTGSTLCRAVNVDTRNIRNKMEDARVQLTMSRGNRIFEEIGVGNFVAQRRADRVRAFSIYSILWIFYRMCPVAVRHCKSCTTTLYKKAVGQ